MNPWLGLNRDGKYYVYDPLVLDLGKTGIDTVGVDNQTTQKTYFDHNQAGIKTSTGWITPEDGFLVLDRNGDDVINGGSELFGDSTQLKDGTLAKNGYEALSDLDTNHDKKIDANDDQFSQLRVW